MAKKLSCFAGIRSHLRRFLATTGYLATIFVLLRFDLALARAYASHMSDTIVETQYGRLRGVLLNLPNKNLSPVEAYFGLQYASVLGGELRFMPPTSSLEKWDGIRLAVQYRPVCPQRIPSDEELRRRMPLGRVAHFKRIITFLDKQNEECLNLNVYVPVRDKNETKPLSVVLFIHGESYDMGTGNAYDGSVMAAFGHVIVITMNYRLGILGFLSLDDSNAPGNYALLDLVAGLRWIKENIYSFGGNPNQVTIMGQGYGASMVHLLLISPVTKGRDLFQRAILHSGSALASWSIAGESLRYIDLIASRTNCSLHPSPADHRSFLQCLKQLPVDTLVKIDPLPPRYLSAFGPTIDQRIVLPSDVRTMMGKLSESVFARTKLLLGMTRSEGLGYFAQEELERGINSDRMSRMMRTFIQNVFSFHRQSILDVLSHQYTDWEKQSEDPATDRDCLVELLGDAQVTAPVVELAQFHATHGSSTYLFVFSAPPRLDVYPRWAIGAPGDDVAYAFGAPITDGIDPFPMTYTRSDRLLAESVLRYWTNFIKTGDPNVEEESSLQGSSHRGRTKQPDPSWPPYSLNKQEYLTIEKKSVDRGDEGVRSSIRHHFRASKMALWLDLIPRLHKSDDLDPRFHQLENSSDRHSFEEEGTRDVSFPAELVSSTTSTTTHASTHHLVSTAWSNPRRSSSPVTIRGKRTTVGPVAPPLDSQTGAWVDSNPGPDPSDSSSSVLSLRVTIGIGCALLVLNLLIFAGLCYQKDRVRREMRLNTRFLDHLLRGKAAQEMLGPQHDIYSVAPTSSGLHPDLAPDSNGGNSVHLHHHHLYQQQQLLQPETDVASQDITTYNSLQRTSTFQDRSPASGGGQYSMVLPRCLSPSCPATASNHLDCRDGLLLKYLPSDLETGIDDHCSSNPSTTV